MRDLPPQTGSVLPERDFEMCWELSRGAGPRLAEIEQALRSAAAAAGISSNMGEAGATVSEGQSYAAGTAGASSAARPPLLVLATDPDREGEAISWHLVQELQVSMALIIDVLLQRLSCGCLRGGGIVGTHIDKLFLYCGPVQDLALLYLSKLNGLLAAHPCMCVRAEAWGSAPWRRGAAHHLHRGHEGGSAAGDEQPTTGAQYNAQLPGTFRHNSLAWPAPLANGPCLCKKEMHCSN